MTETTLAPTLPGSGSPPAPDPRRWIALAVIALAQLMVVLDATIVNIALPRAQADLGISNADRQWVVTAYTLAFGGLLLLGGRIADFAGRRRTFIIGLIGFAVASAVGGAAVNSGMLFGARVVQGAFGALLAPASLSLLAVTFTTVKDRATAFAVYGAIAGGGSAVGLLLGGVLTEYTSWRWCLFVNIPIAVLAAIGALAVVRESKASGDTRYDIPGAVLVTLGLASLVYGFTQAADQTIGWTSFRSLGFIVAGLVLLAAFAVVESRSEHALLPLRILLDRDRGGSYITSMLVGAGLFAMFLFLSYYFQLVLGYSPIRSGLAFLPFSAGIVATAIVVSSLLPRTGPKPLMAVGSLAAAAGLLSLLRIDLDSSWATTVLPAEVVMSIGLGLLFVPLSSTALVGIGDRDAGVASATLNATQQIGGSLGTALLNTFAASAVTGYLLDRGAAASNPTVQLMAQVHSFHVAFAWGAGLLFVGFVAVVLLIRGGRHTDAPAGGVPAI